MRRLSRIEYTAVNFVVGVAVAAATTTAAGLAFDLSLVEAVTSALGAAAGMSAVVYGTADDRE